MSKIKVLSPSNIQASKGTSNTVTLFLNEDTNTVCYKDTTGKIIQVGIVEKLEDGVRGEPGDARP